MAYLFEVVAGREDNKGAKESMNKLVNTSVRSFSTQTVTRYIFSDNVLHTGEIKMSHTRFLPLKDLLSYI